MSFVWGVHVSSVSSSQVRWGILATGKIAHSFAGDLALVPDNVLVALGSRSEQSARAFAEQYSSPAAPVRAHPSYASSPTTPMSTSSASPRRTDAHEIDEVTACLRAGRTESVLLPLDGTVAVMRVLDEIRDLIGVRYD